MAESSDQDFLFRHNHKRHVTRQKDKHDDSEHINGCNLDVTNPTQLHFLVRPLKFAPRKKNFRIWKEAGLCAAGCRPLSDSRISFVISHQYDVRLRLEKQHDTFPFVGLFSGRKYPFSLSTKRKAAAVFVPELMELLAGSCPPPALRPSLEQQREAAVSAGVRRAGLLTSVAQRVREELHLSSMSVHGDQQA